MAARPITMTQREVAVIIPATHPVVSSHSLRANPQTTRTQRAAARAEWSLRPHSFHPRRATPAAWK